MAQLKSTIVAGDLSVTGGLSAAPANTSTTIASGDKIAIIDSTDANHIAASSISFGTSETQCLTNKGTWKTFSTSAWTIEVPITDWAAATANSIYGITANDYTVSITNSYNIPASTDTDFLLGLALNNTVEARAEAGSIGLRLYEITSGYLRFTASAVPTNTIYVIIKALA